MIKIYQTKVGENGNCFNACLASILELGINDLPPINHKNGVWLKEYQDFLRSFNLGINWVKPIGSNGKFYGYSIGAFERIDKKYSHAVVCLNGRKVHDPFPKKRDSARLGKLLHWYVITILDPSKKPTLNLNK